MRRPRTVVVALVAVLAGLGAALAVHRYRAGFRSADLSVTFVSDPPGATLVSAESRNVLGVSPVTVTYTRPESWTTCVSYRGFRANWPDGRELAVNLIELCPDGGENQELRFSAPDVSSAPRRGSSGPAPAKAHPEDMQHLLEHARGIEKELVPSGTRDDARAADRPAPASSEPVPQTK